MTRTSVSPSQSDHRQAAVALAERPGVWPSPALDLDTKGARLAGEYLFGGLGSIWFAIRINGFASTRHQNLTFTRQR